MSWFDAVPAKQTVNECVKFARKIVQSLAKEELTEIKAKDKSQMLAYVGKTLDQIARLTQFSEGKPDSRQELTLAALLPFLKDEELTIFNRAVERLEQTQTQTQVLVTGDSTKSALH